MASSLGFAFIIQVLLPVLLLFPQRVLCRELIIEELRFGTPSCNSTVQGRHLRSDDRGYVCNVKDINPRTGCCTEAAKQYSCSGCNMASQCCNEYEYCVSCCLDPLRTSSEVALKVKVAKQLTAGTSSTVFDYCLGRCRHNSESVVHENAYVSDEHHCFFPQEQYSDEGPERDDADFGDLTIVIARQGQSCDSACKDRQKVCKLNTLPALNKCTVLKKYLNCKEACIASTGTDQPSEVVKTAPRHMVSGALSKCSTLDHVCSVHRKFLSLAKDHIPLLVACAHVGSAGVVPATGEFLVDKEASFEAEALIRFPCAAYDPRLDPGLSSSVKRPPDLQPDVTIGIVCGRKHVHAPLSKLLTQTTRMIRLPETHEHQNYFLGPQLGKRRSRVPRITGWGKCSYHQRTSVTFAVNSFFPILILSSSKYIIDSQVDQLIGGGPSPHAPTSGIRLDFGGHIPRSKSIFSLFEPSFKSVPPLISV